MNRITRIKQMEECLDRSSEAVKKLSEALDGYKQAQASLRRLTEYYGGALWMQDLEADEAGKLPSDLKRGVLSEDAVYDLMDENRELVLTMLRLVSAAIEKHTI
ncbi:MAG: DUF4298 domain-containing protein [Clostridia bacterium]|nr:DUF4298 domain-containing protein [Clostridia bacterium]MBQ2110525.1 DUF4298 domain-containing protein [Clostridia bacterium]MBQ2191092.1 DUF4298 domain-containing protein [Clostridia bacterium]MBQ3939342.1 DUF4298 domain-containing protein [Clostridia bacterium]